MGVFSFILHALFRPLPRKQYEDGALLARIRSAWLSVIHLDLTLQPTDLVPPSGPQENPVQSSLDNSLVVLF